VSDLVVNVARVAFVAALYLFLLFVALAVRSHLSAAPKSRSDVPPAPPPAPVPALVFRSEGGAARTVEVRGTIIVGREPGADVVIDDEFASGRHARFEAAAGRLTVEDLGSTNGTLVNDRPSSGLSGLDPGDTVRIGETTIEVQWAG
jgi:hypothetical protein